MVQKFLIGCKELGDEAESGQPKTKYSKAVLQAIAVNPASSTQRVSGKLSKW